ncbi:GMC oxidoreductase [Bradyrhizobium sp. NAS80.1]|uniref:GMC family oxidoreductase n=1 Tax=Bradyrhizobium sp. NAS80.1 TaxID=1680159 RepID=UPI0024BF76F4|nr:GMC oxidoreductase [Bradyrhizobium sp. NAS80.1]
MATATARASASSRRSASARTNWRSAPHSLVSEVLFEGDRAVGVAYLSGARLYMGDPNAADAHGPGSPQKAYARREVILAGGAYNTPQILMLSGIGPRAELERHGIAVRLDRPGVGANLHDRYEVCVVHRMIHDYAIFKDQTLNVPGRDGKGDGLFVEWDKDRGGPYSTNGSLAAFVARSSVAGVDPDLYVMALPIDFHGYYPGYAAEAALKHDRLTLLVLKAHTQNRGGTITLVSTDPRDRPLIDFRYFEEGTDVEGKDMQGVLDGIALARRIAARLSSIIADEVIPGRNTDEQGLRDWVHNNAWGHHASCTCKIGAADDSQAVLDGDFRVRGVHGLRVVDASVFPRIPAIFVCSAVYMVSERASDVIIAQNR